jgi:hypothetical protein
MEKLLNKLHNYPTKQTDAMNNYVIRIDQGTYAPHVRFLQNELDFKDLAQYEKKGKRLISVRTTIVETISFFIFLIRKLSQLKNTHTIVSIGWASIFIKLLIKLGVIECQQFFWLGFFVHQKKCFAPLKRLLALTAIQQERYIINSEADRPIYRKHLNIPNYKLVSLPYGDFSAAEIDKHVVKSQVGTYYFAGGFTNRDYASLIDAFRTLDQQLIIVGSHLNKDLQVSLPPNIKVLRDIPKKQFNSLVKNARACILPLKDKTGASGQMVMLSYMKQGKAIIVPDMQITQEYLEEGVSGLFYQNARLDIPNIIRYLDQDEEKIVQMGLTANQQYNQNLGGEVTKQRLAEIVSTTPVVQKNY